MSRPASAVWVVAGLAFLCGGCRGRGQAFPVNDAASIPCSQDLSYFPAFIQGEAPLHFGTDQAEWESLYLKHMGEPSLYHCPARGSEPELRFLWDRSLSPPIAVRLVVHRDRTGTLFVHMLAHPGTVPLLEPEVNGKTVLDEVWYRQTLGRQIEVTRGQVNRVLQMASGIRFRTDHSAPFTTDGSDWIFETEELGSYRVVDFRNDPPENARALGLYLVMTLGGVHLRKGEIY